ncbi:MAG: hypothetical protein ABEJ43_08615 [Haloferacaceae archaeon]
MDVDGFVRDYYEALRRGEPLDPYFAERPETVKIGVFSRQVGGESVAEALRDQTAGTEDWVVESRDLRAFARDGVGHFVDDVRLAWTDARTDRRHDFDTRWTGLAESRAGEPVFVSMHVSASVDPRREDAGPQSEGGDVSGRGDSHGTGADREGA